MTEYNQLILQLLSCHVISALLTVVCYMDFLKPSSDKIANNVGYHIKSDI